MRASLLALLLLPALAVASDTWMADLEQRVRTEGVDRVNAHLGANAVLMARLNQRAADCEPEAVDLTVRLGRTRDAKSGDRHREALRVAVGACTEFVLSRISAAEVPKVCASASTWTITQTARELRRRIGQLDIDERLRATPHGRACRDAYLFELHHTRVGLRVAPPDVRSR